MKFCKDCEFYQKGIESAKIRISDQCRPPSSEKEFDPVTGNELSKSYLPRLARVDGNLCGKEAKWFKPARSIVKKLFGERQ